MATLYNQLFPEGNSVSFSENLFRVFDTNNTGEICFREFLVAMNITSNGSAEDKLSFAFKVYDVDGDGTIEYLEMLKLVTALFELNGTDRVVGKAGEIFEKMDKDCDGMVSQKEFMAVCLEDVEITKMLLPAGTLN